MVDVGCENRSKSEESLVHGFRFGLLGEIGDAIIGKEIGKLMVLKPRRPSVQGI